MKYRTMNLPRLGISSWWYRDVEISDWGIDFLGDVFICVYRIRKRSAISVKIFSLVYQRLCISDGGEITTTVNCHMLNDIRNLLGGRTCITT